MVEGSTVHERILLYGLTISVLSLPFSIALCHAGIFIVAVNWIIEGQWNDKYKKLRQQPLAFFFLALFAWTVFSLIYTEDISNGWFNVEKKFTFAIVPVVLATSVLLSKHLLYLLKAFVLGCLAATIVCLAAAAFRLVAHPELVQLNFGFIQPVTLQSNPFFTNGWLHFTYIALASGVGLHPTYFSIYLMFCIAILLLPRTESIFKKYSLGLAVYFILFLSLLSSRITLVALFLVCVAGLFYLVSGRSRLIPVRLSIALMMLILFVGCTVINPISFYRNFQELSSTPLTAKPANVSDNSTTIRLSLWWTGVVTARNVNTLSGVGAGDTQRAMHETSLVNGISNILNSADPHNQFLYTYISLGTIGVILLLSCYLLPLRAALQRKDLLHIVFIALIVLVSVTESFLESQKGIVFFVLFQSLLSFSKTSSTQTSSAT